MAQTSAYKLQHKREYKRKYDKLNKDKIREIEARRRLKHGDRRKKEKREWLARNRETYNARSRELRKGYRKRRNLIESYSIRKRRVRERFEWSKMHISKKINLKLIEILKEAESSTLVGNVDLTYWNQLKPRLEACKILSENWKEEFDALHDKT